MKVLTDVNVSRELKDGLIDALGMPDVVHSARERGWADKENGDLQRTAMGAGFTHMVTCDKSMANEHKPHMPVLVVDNPSHGESGRLPGSMSADETWQMTLAAASAVADVLLGDPPTRPDYYAVPIPGYVPRKQLQRIIDGRHRRNPNYDADRERRARQHRARGLQPRRGKPDTGID